MATRCDFTGDDAADWGATFTFSVTLTTKATGKAIDVSAASATFAIGPTYQSATVTVTSGGGAITLTSAGVVTVTVTDELMEIGDGTKKLNYRHALKLFWPDGTEDRLLEGRIAINPGVI